MCQHLLRRAGGGRAAGGWHSRYDQTGCIYLCAVSLLPQAGGGLVPLPVASVSPNAVWGVPDPVKVRAMVVVVVVVVVVAVVGGVVAVQVLVRALKLRLLLSHQL